jgi:Tol biopolymer transport system component
MIRRAVHVRTIAIVAGAIACTAAQGSASAVAVEKRVAERAAPVLAYWANVGGEDAEIHVVRADGTGRRVLTNNRLNDYVSGWSPQGRWLVYKLLNRRGVASHYAFDLDRSKLVYIGGMITGAVWSPDERKALTGHRTDNHLQVVDLVTGTRRPVFARGWAYLEEFGWTPDSRTILFSATRYNDFDVPKVFAADADGTRLRRLVRDGRAPVPSPDGRWIAFLRDINLYYSTVHVIRPDGSGLRRLSPVRINDGLGTWRWSPTGHWIAIEQSLRNARTRLGVIDVARGDVRWLSEGSRYGGKFEWTPDGRKILHACGNGLCLADVVTGRTRKVSGRLSVGYGTWGLSPDWRRVAIASEGRGVHVLTLTDRKLRRLTASGYFVSWSPDGNWMTTQHEARLQVVRLSDGKTTHIARSYASPAAWRPLPR